MTFKLTEHFMDEPNIINLFESITINKCKEKTI